MDVTGRAYERDAVREIRDKLEVLRRVAGERRLGVVVEAAAGPVTPIVGLPTGVAGVYGLIGRLEGTYFRFVRPDAVVGPEAWAAREVVEDCPVAVPHPGRRRRIPGTGTGHRHLLQ